MTTLANRRLTIWRAVLLAVAVSLLVSLVAPTASQAVEVDPPASTDSVLVVAPHPADATIMAGGISYALPSFAGGAGVTIAYMTNNDFGIPGGDDGTLQLEAVTAQTTHLNRVEDDLIFLGYPDGELQLVWDKDGAVHTAGTGLSATYASRGLGSTDWHDFRMGPGEQHADYTKPNMIADMEALIDLRRPDHIFLGGPENRNTDYTTTYDVVAAALDNVVAANPGYGAVLHTTVVWHPDPALDTKWPQDIDPAVDIISDEDPSIDPPAVTTLADAGLVWAEREQFVVPTDLQNPVIPANPKAQAIDEFTSQSGLGGFIGRFVHRDEIFWAEYVNYPEISIDDVTIAESGADAVFTISRTGALNVAVSVTATTSDGTATAGEDYTATTETVDLDVGEASATFSVPTSADDIDEADETFTVTLTAPTNDATLDDATGVGTITDDDTAGITVDDGDGLSLIEGGASDTYTVVLESEPTANVVVTVTPDAQVTAAPSPLTFTPANWDSAQTVIVTGIADGADETDPHTGVISHTAASTDAKYSGFAIDDVTADIVDATDLIVGIDGLKAGSIGVASEFTASVLGGGNGTVTYAWTVTRGTTTVATGTGATLSFTPTAGGLHTVSVVPTDDDGPHDPVSVSLNVLTDIQDSTFVNDIIWLADAGITAGCNPPANDQFCPDRNVTRGQMAAFLVRALDLTDDGGGNTFTDDDGSVFEDDIAKLAAAGITTGCNADGTNFCPDDFVTRGQMAAFIRRADNLS